jgi:TrmH family RNA methyltransferase
MTTVGRVKEITSVSNPIIKHIRSLSLKKNRDAEGLFMAEGLKLVTDALEADWEIDTLIFAKQMQEQPHLQAIAARVRGRGGNILIVSDRVLTAISRRDNPQMVIGIFRQRWHEMKDLMAMLQTGGDVVLALDRIRDPGNLGTIIRTADAAGIKAVLLIGETTDPFSLEATRATMGSIFQIPLLRTGEVDFIDWTGTSGVRIAGTHLKGAVDFRSVAWQEKPCVIVMGNEQQGLTGALAEACTDLVIIPMTGLADSLNLAIASGIMLFEVRKSELTFEAMKTRTNA